MIHCINIAMIAKIQKWGNSLALRIPRSFAKEARVEQNSQVDLKVERGRLVISRVEPGGYRLADLLADVTKDNVHDAVETGPPRGRELL